MDNDELKNVDELEAAKKQAEEYLNNWKRERADFVNYKKDEARRVEEIVKYSNESLIMELVEVIDDLEIALRNFPMTDKERKEELADWVDGLKKTMKKVNDLLAGYGVERIKVEDKFDPALHEAIEVETGGQKVQEVRGGYTMHGRVIRPARVKIVK